MEHWTVIRNLLGFEVIGAALCAALLAARAYAFARALPREDGGKARAVALLRFRWGVLWAKSAQIAFLVALICTSLIARLGIIAWAIGYYVALTLIQAQAGHAVNRAVRGTEASHLEFLHVSARTLGGTVALYLGYYAVAYGIGGTLSAAHVVDWIGMPLGVLAGLFFMGAASPLFVRVMMPCSRVTDPRVIEILEKCFRRAGLPVPAFWTLRLERFRLHNAMVAGFRHGRGWLRPALFFTSNLLETLSLEEFEAVMLHEVSHVALHHVRKRLLACFFVYLASLVPFLAFIYTVVDDLPDEWAIPAVAVSVLAQLALQLVVVRRVVRRQELEADRNALVLGASVEALAGALSRLTELNDQSSKKRDPSSFLNASAAHPLPAERIRLLRDWAQAHAASLPPAATGSERPPSAAA